MNTLLYSGLGAKKLRSQCDLSIIATDLGFFGFLLTLLLKMWRTYRVYTIYESYLED